MFEGETDCGSTKSIKSYYQISRSKSANTVLLLVLPPYAQKKVQWSNLYNSIICSIWSMKMVSWEALLEVHTLLHQPYFSWNSLGSWGCIFLMETKRNEKCGWGCFFQGPWRVCDLRHSGWVSGWGWVWIGTLHLGHMCFQQGQKDVPRTNSDSSSVSLSLSMALFCLISIKISDDVTDHATNPCPFP